MRSEDARPRLYSIRWFLWLGFPFPVLWLQEKAGAPWRNTIVEQRYTRAQKCSTAFGIKSRIFPTNIKREAIGRSNTVDPLRRTDQVQKGVKVNLSADDISEGGTQGSDGFKLFRRGRDPHVVTENLENGAIHVRDRKSP